MRSGCDLGLVPTTLAALALLGAVRGADVTLDDVVSYGLSLTEFNAVRDSESPFDFGGLSAPATDQLWSDAARFEYEVRRPAPGVLPRRATS